MWPSAASVATCGSVGADEECGMVRTISAVQAASSTTPIAPSTASVRHLGILTGDTIRDESETTQATRVGAGSLS